MIGAVLGLILLVRGDTHLAALGSRPPDATLLADAVPDPSAATTAVRQDERKTPEPDPELLRDLELLQNLDLLDHLDLFD